MALLPLRLLFLLMLLRGLSLAAGDVAAAEWTLAPNASIDVDAKTCHGLVGECAGGDSDEDIATGMERRVLAAKAGQRFISYGALIKNKVPCNRRGQSYYNCQQRGRANPYRRGCSAITRCARILH